MILDSLKLDTFVVQLLYETSYMVWDHAGAVATGMCAIWPDLKLVEATPPQQTLKARGIQVQTGIRQSTLTFTNQPSLDSRVMRQVSEAVGLWHKHLTLEQATRVSARASFAREYPSMKEANAALLAMNLARFPDQKVFDQPVDSDLNSIEVLFRFEDKESFSFVRLKAEQVKYELELDFPFEDQELKKTVNRLVIDFDRGVIGKVKMSELRMEDWLKGYQHVLRRDLEKVIGSQI
jgi:hypothetical protein